MAFKKFTGSSDVFKFDVPGKSIEGVFQGFTEGTFGPIMLIKQDGVEEVTRCSTNTGLMQCFDEAFGSYKSVKPGVRVRVTFTEAVLTKKGGTWKKYLLEVDEDALPNDEIGY